MYYLSYDKEFSCCFVSSNVLLCKRNDCEWGRIGKRRSLGKNGFAFLKSGLPARSGAEGNKESFFFQLQFSNNSSKYRKFVIPFGGPMGGKRGAAQGAGHRIMHKTASNQHGKNGRFVL